MIEVTQQDIDESIKASCTKCPNEFDERQLELVEYEKEKARKNAKRFDPSKQLELKPIE